MICFRIFKAPAQRRDRDTRTLKITEPDPLELHRWDAGDSLVQPDQRHVVIERILIVVRVHDDLYA